MGYDFLNACGADNADFLDLPAFLDRIAALKKAGADRVSIIKQVGAKSKTQETDMAKKTKKPRAKRPAKLAPAKAAAPTTGALKEPKFIKDATTTPRAKAMLHVIESNGGQATVAQLIAEMGKDDYKPSTVNATIYDMNYDGWIRRVAKGTYTFGPRYHAPAKAA